ncbi:HupE/UreJ family protein [Paenibacillus sp. TRM 82003]|nr:HupE/UreJ family protein [Paenibacillus sp. TRM 82003]
MKRLTRLRKMAVWLLAFLCFGGVWGSEGAQAHFSSTGYSDISADEKNLYYKLYLTEHDVIEAMPLDVDGDGKLSEEELRGSQETLRKFASDSIAVTGDGRLTDTQLRAVALAEKADQRMLEFDLVFPFEEPVGLYVIQYGVFYDGLDNNHRSFATIRIGESTVTQVINPNNNILQIQGSTADGTSSGASITGSSHDSASSAAAGWVQTFGAFTFMGMEHIWSGIDHLLFVFGLMLSARHAGRWTLVKLLTAFTIGHSVTLVLASLKLASASPVIVEPLIALSIVYVAVENIRKKEKVNLSWQVPALFGLIHGFGFAGLLEEAVSGAENVALPLFSFNLGVELGQFAVVLAVLPLLWLLRQWTARPAWVYVSSGTIGAFGCFWFVERVASL